MRLGGQLQACLFFLRKDFWCTKAQIEPKPTNKRKLSEQKTTKAKIFLAQKLLRGENHLFCVLVLFCAQNLFVKKRLEIVLITSFTILLICTGKNFVVPIFHLYSL